MKTPPKQASSVDWEALARGIGTLVFFMGVKNLPHITRQLTAHGMSPDKPVAVVRWGTTAAQQTVTGTLATIEGAVRAAGITAPAIIVVGEVVSLRETLQWFEKRPLMAKTVVVTRAREQASDLLRALSELGAACLECPTIRCWRRATRPPWNAPSPTWDPMTGSFLRASTACAFSSSASLHRVVTCVALGHLRTAAIGPATAERLRSFGLTTDILPDSYRAEAVAAAFAREAVRGKKILLPRAREARSVLPEALKTQGAVVDEVVAYETMAVADSAEALLQRLEKRQIDLVTFTSSSTVKNFKALLPADRAAELASGLPAACIGPVTADTARRLGFDVRRVAAEYTIPGLCAVILDHFSGPGEGAG
jgi:uroporphyrinogen III methyltransferase / synthase